MDRILEVPRVSPAPACLDAIVRRRARLGALLSRLRTFLPTGTVAVLIAASIFAFLQPARAQSRGEEYSALEYWEQGRWVPNGPSPEAVCLAYANLWVWNRNGFSFTTDQVSAGLWKCQRYYNGTLEPFVYTYVRGACQTAAAAPILTGSFWNYPNWDESKGVCFCAPSGRYFDRNVQWCDNTPPKVFTPDRDKSCKTGNPVSPSSGIKQQVEIDYSSPAGDSIRRVYQYRSAFTPVAPPFGIQWQLQTGPSLELPPGTNPGPVKVKGVDGEVTRFEPGGGGSWYATSPSKDLLIELIGVSGRTGWRYYDRTANALAVFSASGQLQSLWYSGGRSTNFTYSTAATPPDIAPWIGVLIRLESVPGRTIDFVRSAAGVTQAIIPGAVKDAAAGSAQSPIRYRYSEAASLGSGVGARGQLTSITFPDGTVRRYHYEDSRFPMALSGITDERSLRWSDYFYDVSGRVLSERHRNGGAGFVNQYESGRAHV